MAIPFLSAYWQNLVVVNFKADPKLLIKYLPRGTELDYYNGETYISLVAFSFSRNKFLGLIPTYPAYSFEEINLRFYIKRGDKRAVSFIKEVVPSKIIAKTARILYNEPYVAVKTLSKIINKQKTTEYNYTWGKNLDYSIQVETDKNFQPLKKDSLEEFILEHYWGYTIQPDASTVEYQVKHPKWNYSSAINYQISDNIRDFYGNDFKEILSTTPASIFVADGSKISVSLARRFFHPLNDKTPKGWVLYDGLCGFCSWWIPLWGKVIAKAGYDIAPVQSTWVKENLRLNEEQLNEDIRLLLNDGTLINGADAYIYGMKRVWWSMPVGWVLGLPVLRELTWKFYKYFNRNRFLVSKLCKLRPEL